MSKNSNSEAGLLRGDSSRENHKKKLEPIRSWEPLNPQEPEDHNEMRRRHRRIQSS